MLSAAFEEEGTASDGGTPFFAPVDLAADPNRAFLSFDKLIGGTSSVNAQQANSLCPQHFIFFSRGYKNY